MHLYLVQHGIPKSKTEDPTRPLSDVGRVEVESLGDWAAQAGVKIGQIRHSGKKRARETAEILASHLKPPGGVVVVEGMAPLDAVQPIAAALPGEEEAIMLVGHLPFMSRLVSYLTNGDPEQSLVRFRMGGIVCLGDEEGWQIEWAITPELAV